jgi:hypothetical protein
LVGWILKIYVLPSFILFNGNFITKEVDRFNCCSSLGGKCVGSSYCTACTNCSRCKLCSNGDSFGVCLGRSNRSTYPSNSNLYTPSPKNNTKIPNGNTNGSSKSKKVTDLKFVVIAQELKLRSGPGAEFEVVENLTLGDQLNYIDKESGWINVTTHNGSVGFGFYKFVKFIE